MNKNELPLGDSSSLSVMIKGVDILKAMEASTDVFKGDFLKKISTKVLASDLGEGFSLMALAIATENKSLQEKLDYISMDRLSSESEDNREFAFNIASYTDSEVREVAKFLLKDSGEIKDSTIRFISGLHRVNRLPVYRNPFASKDNTVKFEKPKPKTNDKRPIVKTVGSLEKGILAGAKVLRIQSIYFSAN